MPYDDLLQSAQQFSSAERKELKELVKSVARGTYQPTLSASPNDDALVKVLNQFADLKKQQRHNYYLKFVFVSFSQAVKVQPFLALTKEGEVHAVDFDSLDMNLVASGRLPVYQKPRGSLLELNLAYIVRTDTVAQNLSRTLLKIASKLSGESAHNERVTHAPSVQSEVAPVRPQPEQQRVENYVAPASTPPTPEPSISLEQLITRPIAQVVTLQKVSRQPLQATDFTVALAAAAVLFLIFQSVVAGIFGGAIALSIFWIGSQRTVTK